MKNIFSIIFTTFVVLSLFNQLQAQDKTVIWMHGLNDERKYASNTALNNMATAFASERQMISKVLNSKDWGIATNTDGIEKFADGIANYHSNNGITDALYVGYSMGAAAGRELAIRQSQGRANGVKFKGMVTLGGFFHGAKVSNSIQPWNGQYGPSNATVFAQSALWESLRGTRAALYTVGGLGVLYDHVQSIISSINLVSGGGLLQAALGNMIPLEKTAKDMLVGGAYNESRKNIPNTIPVVHVYGNAPQPIVQHWVEYAGFASLYKTFMDLNMGAFEITRWIPAVADYMPTECLASYFYMKETINGHFLNLITDDVRWTTQNYTFTRGFRTLSCFNTAVSETRKSCRKWGWFRWICQTFTYWYNVVKCVTVDTFKDENYTYSVPIYPETDGILDKKTATAEGLGWRGDAIVKAEGINHLELAKSDVVKDIFKNRIWNGNRYNRGQNDKDEFYISTRP